MSFELAAYALFVGIVYSLFKNKSIVSIYTSLITAMIAGRIVWGGAQMILLGIQNNSLTWNVFITSAVLNAIPGICIQLILIPPIVMAINRIGIGKKRNKEI